MHYLWGENLVLIIILIVMFRISRSLLLTCKLSNNKSYVETSTSICIKLSCFGIIPWLKTTKVVMLWFNFILGLIIFIFFCFKLIIIHYHTQKQKKIKFKPKIKLNHNSYIDILLYDNLIFSPKFPYLFWQIPDENSSDVYLELPSTTRWLSFSDNDDIERCKWFLLKSCVCVLCDNIKTSWSHIMGLLALRILRSQKNF